MKLEIVRLKGRGRRNGEKGFTLPEMLITIAILGILVGIATSSWFGVIEGRRVDAATNQVASDFRLAHARATNQLVNWRVEYTPGSGAYRLVRASDGFAVDRSLEDGSRILSSEMGAGASSITFRPDGSVDTMGFSDAAPTNGEIDVVVSTDDGSPMRTIRINPVTSRVERD